MSYSSKTLNIVEFIFLAIIISTIARMSKQLYEKSLAYGQLSKNAFVRWLKINRFDLFLESQLNPSKRILIILLPQLVVNVLAKPLFRKLFDRVFDQLVLLKVINESCPLSRSTQTLLSFPFFNASSLPLEAHLNLLYQLFLVEDRWLRLV